MALLSANLFYKKRKEFTLGTVFDKITFDVILNENHSFNSSVSDHRIENGSVISDHINNDVISESLTVMVSNYSVNHRFRADGNRAQNAYDKLKALWEAREAVTIVTVLETFNDVAITSISVPRSIGDGESLTFSISFKQIQIVKLKTVLIDTVVNVNEPTTPQNQQASSPADMGRTITL